MYRKDKNDRRKQKQHTVSSKLIGEALARPLSCCGSALPSQSSHVHGKNLKLGRCNVHFTKPALAQFNFFFFFW